MTPDETGNTEKLLLTPEGRGLLRAQHTCIRKASSMACLACNRGIPYPSATVDELLDEMTVNKTRPTASMSGREPCPAVSTPGLARRPSGTVSTPGHAAHSECPKCGYNPAATVAAKHFFLIKRDPPSMNRRLVNTLVGGQLYRREKSAWMMEIRAARLAHKLPYAYRATDDRSSWPVIAGKRRITIERGFAGRQRERDLDNLVGGMKPCVDALVAERLLVDDSPSHAEIHYKQRRTSPGDGGLWFEIEILGE